MKKVKFYRNVPFLDIDKKARFLVRLFPFYFQKFENRIWIELPFVGVEIRKTEI